MVILRRMLGYGLVTAGLYVAGQQAGVDYSVIRGLPAMAEQSVLASNGLLGGAGVPSDDAPIAFADRFEPKAGARHHASTAAVHAAPSGKGPTPLRTKSAAHLKR